MRSYVMRFMSSEALSQALEMLMDSDCVASCMAEPEAHRVWFLARSDGAEALVQRIYLDGGLTSAADTDPDRAANCLTR